MPTAKVLESIGRRIANQVENQYVQGRVACHALGNSQFVECQLQGHGVDTTQLLNGSGRHNQPPACKVEADRMRGVFARLVDRYKVRSILYPYLCFKRAKRVQWTPSTRWWRPRNQRNPPSGIDWTSG